MNAMYVQQGYTALTKPKMSLFLNIIVGPKKQQSKAIYIMNSLVVNSFQYT